MSGDKRRLVARLGALAFDSFDKRGFFAANVSAGTDENGEVERNIGAEDFFAQQSLLIAAHQLAAQDVLLLLILVADVEVSALGADVQAG